MKGLSSFVVKSMIIIAAIISITYVLNQIMSFQTEVSEKSKMFDYTSTAYHILDLLASEQCLGVDSSSPDMARQKILDYNKILEFSKLYNETEPNCAKNYEYGYSIKIEKFQWNWTGAKVATTPGIPFGNRDVGLSFDTSGSMSSKINGGMSSKINESGNAAKILVDCMDDTDRLTIITYLGCSTPVSLSLTPVKGNRGVMKERISTFQSSGPTPILQSLDATMDELSKGQKPPGNDTPYDSQTPIIILMTDGGQNCGYYDYSSWINEANKRIDKMKDIFGSVIPIYTVGFTITSSSPPGRFLKYMSEHTGGESFFVNSGDEMADVFCSLVKKTEAPPPEEYQEWNMGFNMSGGNVNIGNVDRKFVSSMVNVSIPIEIKFSENKVYPGKLTITLFKGEIFDITGLIDQVCHSGNETRKRIHLSRETYSLTKNGKNYVCQKEGSSVFCRRVGCGINEFKILPGSYDITVVKKNNIVKVIS